MSYNPSRAANVGTTRVDWTEHFLAQWRFYQDRKEISPAEKIARAVLLDALNCLSWRDSDNDDKRKAYREALNWVTTQDEDYVFSFNVVCRTVGLEPDYIRPRVLKALANGGLDITTRGR